MSALLPALILISFRGGSGASGAKVIIALCVLIFSAVTSFIIGVRMRREIRRTLGRKARSEDLTDLDTWIEVKEAETKAPGKKPPNSDGRA